MLSNHCPACTRTSGLALHSIDVTEHCRACGRPPRFQSVDLHSIGGGPITRTRTSERRHHSIDADQALPGRRSSRASPHSIGVPLGALHSIGVPAWAGLRLSERRPTPSTLTDHCSTHTFRASRHCSTRRGTRTFRASRHCSTPLPAHFPSVAPLLHAAARALSDALRLTPSLPGSRQASALSEHCASRHRCSARGRHPHFPSIAPHAIAASARSRPHSPSAAPHSIDADRSPQVSALTEPSCANPSMLKITAPRQAHALSEHRASRHHCSARGKSRFPSVAPHSIDADRSLLRSRQACALSDSFSARVSICTFRALTDAQLHLHSRQACAHSELSLLLRSRQHLHLPSAHPCRTPSPLASGMRTPSSQHCPTPLASASAPSELTLPDSFSTRVRHAHVSELSLLLRSPQHLLFPSTHRCPTPSPLASGTLRALSIARLLLHSRQACARLRALTPSPLASASALSERSPILRSHQARALSGIDNVTCVRLPARARQRTSTS